MTGIVDTESTINFNDGAYNFTGGNTAWKAFVPNGQEFGAAPLPDGSDDLLLTPAGVGTSINGTANAVGISGGGGSGLAIGSGEAIRLDYVNDLTGNPAGSGGDHVFADHYEVNGAAVSFGGINIGSAAARFTAYDDPDGNDAVGDGVPDNVTSVAIRFAGEIRAVDLAAFVNPVIVGGHSFTISKVGASVIVDGLVNGAAIATYTATGFNSLEVAYVSGNPFSITGFGTASVLNAPVSFNVPVEVVDADGDAVGSSIGVTLEPEVLPVASVNFAANLLTQANASSVVTIHFSEAPVNFTDADISAVGGTVTGLAATADPLVYTATFTATAGFTGIGSVTVGTAWQDANGNPGVGDDDTVAIDLSNPTVTDVVANDLVITELGCGCRYLQRCRDVQPGDEHVGDPDADLRAERGLDVDADRWRLERGQHRLYGQLYRGGR